VTINEDGGNLQTSRCAPAPLDHQRIGRDALRRQCVHPGGSKADRHYRVHTMYRPKPWATISGAFNDRERHNNTNNNQAAVAAATNPYEGPINHVDHTRIASLGAVLSPNEHFGSISTMGTSDVYAANQHLTMTMERRRRCRVRLRSTASGGAAVCPGVFTRGSTTQLADWFARELHGCAHAVWVGGAQPDAGETAPRQLGYRVSA